MLILRFTARASRALAISTFKLDTPFEAFPNLKPFRIKFILKRILLKDESKNIQNELGP